MHVHGCLWGPEVIVGYLPCAFSLCFWRSVSLNLGLMASVGLAGLWKSRSSSCCPSRTEFADVPPQLLHECWGFEIRYMTAEPSPSPMFCDALFWKYLLHSLASYFCTANLIFFKKCFLPFFWEWSYNASLAGLGTWYVDQTGLELGDLPASASWVLEVKVWDIMLRPLSSLYYLFK